MRESDTWRFITRAYLAIRTWSRRTIWGDRLFLRFEGPMTVLLQSRASSLRDVLTNRDVDEIAHAEPGAVQAAVRHAQNATTEKDAKSGPADENRSSTPHLRVASVQRDGKVQFQQADDFQAFTQKGSTASS
ncbi:MAG: hypothetical protein M1823_005670 [Watsoniomyces obsoletus]|nr:MAG: hypothetical protein M1823_005670 [Watsoniomyces obsoletus]